MWTFQLSVQVEAEELMETLGICGSFDQDVTNDLTDKDNNIHKVLNILKVLLLTLIKLTLYCSIKISTKIAKEAKITQP